MPPYITCLALQGDSIAPKLPSGEAAAGLLILVYRPVVFPDRLGKEMGAIVLGNKVQVFHLGWKKGGLK